MIEVKSPFLTQGRDMNSRERVLAALDHREPDRIPLDLGAGISCKMHVHFYARLLEHFGMKEDIVLCSKIGQSAYASNAMLERLECDVRTPWPTHSPSANAAVADWEDDEYLYHRDIWSTGYRMPKSLPLYYDMHRFPLADATDEEKAAYAWPELNALDKAGARQAKAFQDAGYPVAFIDSHGNGFLQTGPRLYGFDNWLSMLALEEDDVAGFLDRLLESKMRYYDNLFALYGDSLDIVSESDDLATQNSLFMSPDMFRAIFKPYWKKLFEHIRSRSRAKITLHCCGACEPLLGDFIELGLDVLNPVQISAAGMDPHHLKKEYGKDLAFWGGGVDTQKILPHGTPDEVRDNVKRNIDAFARDGGFVFATIHNTQADVPVENFIAMWETFMDRRNY